MWPSGVRATRSCCCTGSRARSTTGRRSPSGSGARTASSPSTSPATATRMCSTRSRSPRPCGSWARPIDQIGVDRPAVVGHSFGAPLAITWAAERPVSAMVLALAGGHGAVQPSPGPVRHAVPPRDRGHRAAVGEAGGQPSPAPQAGLRLVRRHVADRGPRRAGRAPAPARGGQGRADRPRRAAGPRVARPAGADRARPAPARSSSGASTTAAAGRTGRRWPRRSPARSSCCPASATCR